MYDIVFVDIPHKEYQVNDKLKTQISNKRATFADSVKAAQTIKKIPIISVSMHIG